MTQIQDIFRAALTAVVKNNWGVQTQISKLTGLTPQKINKFVTGEMKAGLEDDRRAIAAALGYQYDQFLDIGRRALGLSVTRPDDPPSPEVAGYLDKARAVLDAGGKNAETIKNMLDIMKE